MDAADGADFIQDISEHYSLPLNKVIAAGHSAGGHLATWLAGRKNVSEKSPLYTGPPLKIHGVISFAEN